MVLKSQLHDRIKYIWSHMPKTNIAEMILLFEIILEVLYMYVRPRNRGAFEQKPFATILSKRVCRARIGKTSLRIPWAVLYSRNVPYDQYNMTPTVQTYTAYKWNGGSCPCAGEKHMYSAKAALCIQGILSLGRVPPPLALNSHIPLPQSPRRGGGGMTDCSYWSPFTYMYAHTWPTSSLYPTILHSLILHSLLFFFNSFLTSSKSLLISMSFSS
jgi:hypothetical protein